jgi:rsbT antagonist protein RsbS
VQVPILRQGAHLIATVQSALTDEDLKQLRDTLVLQVSKVRARGVIVDVTALDVIDSEVAFSMVKLGLTLEGVATSLDREESLAYLNRNGNAHAQEGRTHRR